MINELILVEERINKNTFKNEDDLEKLQELIEKYSNGIKELDKYFIGIDQLKELVNNARAEYDKYRKQIIEDVTIAQQSHQVPRRLASLETRITLLEGLSHGCGTQSDKVSGEKT